jgi:hypothetical protein
MGALGAAAVLEATGTLDATGGGAGVGVSLAMEEGREIVVG